MNTPVGAVGTSLRNLTVQEVGFVEPDVGVLPALLDGNDRVIGISWPPGDRFCPPPPTTWLPAAQVAVAVFPIALT
jgi:hypothetical protein